MGAGGAIALHGRGNGHGRGLSQWGARGAADAGLTAAAILNFYYPTTSTTRTADAPIRVLLAEADADSEQITAAAPLQVIDVVADRALTLPAGTTGIRIARTAVGQRIDVSTGGSWLPLRQPVPPPAVPPRPSPPALASRPGASGAASMAGRPPASATPGQAGNRSLPAAAPTPTPTEASTSTPAAPPTEGSTGTPVTTSTPTGSNATPTGNATGTGRATPTGNATPTDSTHRPAPIRPRIVIAGPLRVSAGQASLALVPRGGAARRYAGDLTVLASADADPWSQAAGPHLSVIDTVAMSTYLRGVVPAEMPASWPAAALRAQAVAARTYAAYERSTHAEGVADADLCDTTACQVYAGLDVADPRSDAAVGATAGQVRSAAGRLIDAQFGASNGGYTAAGGTPYLPAKPDRYEHAPTWTQQLRAADVARRYPQVGRLRAVRVVARDGHGADGGRVTALRLIGTTPAGHPTSVSVQGADAVRLEMPSSWWAPPPAPKPRPAAAAPGSATTPGPCAITRHYCTSVD